MAYRAEFIPQAVEGRKRDVIPHRELDPVEWTVSDQEIERTLAWYFDQQGQERPADEEAILAFFESDWDAARGLHTDKAAPQWVQDWDGPSEVYVSLEGAPDIGAGRE